MYNVFTVDLEDWFYSEDHYGKFDLKDIGLYRDNLVKNTLVLLELLKEFRVSATFFVLGRLAEDLPELLKTIVAGGHEIAIHGYSHRNLVALDGDLFREELALSVDAVFSATGIMPEGYRAPNFSINEKTMWAYYILKELGFVYDSSVQPISIHPGYGIKGAPLQPFIHDSGIIEIPMSCTEIMKLRIPCSGGGYFRHYPYILFRYLLKQCNRQERHGVFYIHPWELGASYRTPEVSGLAKYRKYHNAGKTLPRLKNLFRQFSFIPMAELIKKLEFTYER